MRSFFMGGFMNCGKCNAILRVNNLGTSTICKDCYNKYYRKYRQDNREKINLYNKEWSKTRRWLDGAEDDHLLGEDIDYNLRVVNGQSYI